MRTERVFLMELFLDDELPKKIKLLIKDRFAELEEVRVSTNGGTQIHYEIPAQALVNQSPSMQRIMAQNPDLIPKPPQPVTPAAAQALAARQALLEGANKVEKGRTAPRKV